MPIELNSERISLLHPKGASAELLLYGAHVISWKSADKRNPTPVDRLFLSSKAALDGSKPVRGGIPVIFPAFGAPTHPEHMSLKQHGFARNTVWKYDGSVADNETEISVKLSLEPTAEIQAVYQRPFKLAYIVTLMEFELKTALHVTNTSTSTVFPPDILEFQALFHNYIQGDANSILVTPLQGVTYHDKTELTPEGVATAKKEDRAGVDVKKFTDSVYEDAPGKYEITWRGGGMEVQAGNLKDVVVWNPQAEAGAKIGDMEQGGWEKFVCVEPGYVKGFQGVNPGSTWIGYQVLSVVHEERRMSL